MMKRIEVIGATGVGKSTFIRSVDWPSINISVYGKGRWQKIRALTGLKKVCKMEVLYKNSDIWEPSVKDVLTIISTNTVDSAVRKLYGLSWLKAKIEITQKGSTPPPRTVSLSVVSDPLVVQPADAFSGCGIVQYNQRHHFAPRPALNSAGGEPGHA